MPALQVIQKQRTPQPQYVQDPTTGYLYLEIKSGSVGHDFTLERKIEFVALYKAMFPDLTGVCEQLGMSRNTYYQHIKFDSAFSRDIQEIREQKSDKVESVLMQVALQPKPAAFMDRIAFLRAYRPDRYTEKRINLTAKDLDPGTLEHKARAIDTVLDTELIGADDPHPVTVTQAVELGSQEPRSVTTSQEDSTKNLTEKNLGPVS